MTKDEALKLALEALITINDAIYVNSQQEADAVYKANDAITAIRETLAQPEQEMEQPEIFCGVDYADGVLAVSVMRRRPDDVAELLHMEQIELAQPVQEPVGSVVRWLDGSLVHGWFSDPPPEGTLLYITPPAVQPQRPWVGLTDEEKLDLLSDAKGMGGRICGDGQLFSLLEEHEAKLKEKNT